MAENPQDKLKQGIAAAQRGDKTAARRLLQQVLSEDRDNELAWIWMASVVDSVDERRACLERVLKINPNNARAKEALRRLGFEPPSERAADEVPSAVAAAASAAADALRSGGNRTLYFAIATAVTILLIALFLASLFSGAPNDNAVLQTATSFAVAQLPTQVPPTVDPDTYTATPFLGIIVTVGADSNTALPPTFTPTASATATQPPPPTATPLPLSSFPFVYSALSGDGVGGLFGANADGSGIQPLATEFGEAFALSQDGARVAFVRQVPASADFVQPTAVEGEEAPPPINTIPQIFVASMDDLAAAQQITQMVGTTMSRPAWTSDGARIVFSSNQDGDSELYIIDAAGSTAPTALTNNDANDSDPAISPDGRTIVFASDLETPGSQELFSVSVAGGDVQQLTNASGSSTSPAYSPDGSRIVFVSDRGGDGDIWMMDATGQRPFLVTIDDGDAEDRAPAWTPDSRWIMFVSNRDGETFQVYLISPDGSTLLPVTSGTDNVQSIGMMPMSLP